jgi:hypothetical protein
MQLAVVALAARQVLAAAVVWVALVRPTRIEMVNLVRPTLEVVVEVTLLSAMPRQMAVTVVPGL